MAAGFSTNWIRTVWNRLASTAAAKTLFGFAGTAITQTYSTAAASNPAVTTHAITDSSGGSVSTSAIAAQTLPTSLTVSDGVGTNDGTIGAITADASVIAAVQEIAATVNAAVTQLTAIRNAIATLAAEAELTKADLLACKKLENQIVDDLQAAGIQS